MTQSPAQALLARESRVGFGPVPHTLEGTPMPETSWYLAGDEFLLRAHGGHYMHYRKGAGVTIERGPGARPEEEPLWLSGSVYSAIACINGFVPIHASAVCHDGAVHAFTGPSGAGKSTLVTALAARGLPLFSDDTLVLDPSGEGPLLALPGHKRLKLTSEALALTGAAAREEVGGVVAKRYAEPEQLWTGGPLPLAALYFLEAGDTCAIAPLLPSERMLRLRDGHYTTMQYAAHHQLDAAQLFAHLARLSAAIPMQVFRRPFAATRFAEGVACAEAHIRGKDTPTPSDERQAGGQC